MRPVAILQHEASQGPGYLLDFLQQQDIPFQIFHPAQGQDLPLRASDHSGLVVPGSNHSVNENLPWIAEEMALLQAALSRDVPVLGHCFGGQLLARAMGAQVHRNAWPHIGWSRLAVTPAARALFGTHCLNMGFQSHLEVTEARMLQGLRERTAELHRVARGVYREWAAGLCRPTWVQLHGGW